MRMPSGIKLAACVAALCSILSFHGLAMAVNPQECRSLMDLYIVIDGSDSISADDFSTLQLTVAGLVNEIELGPAKARIGMLVYSSHVPLSSQHPFYDDTNNVIGAAMTLQHPRDGTNTALGIQHMTTMFAQYGRPNVPWVCVVITDGISKNATDTAIASERAELMGISMFAVGVGHRINAKELQGIASSQQQVLLMDNFDQLAYRLSMMMTKICPCPIPPTLPLAECMNGPRAIGTIRKYRCVDGYLQKGNPTIKCQDDFTWTPLSNTFQCVPCSQKTPDVLYGSCGGQGHTLGTVRSYTCSPGYLPVGNPDIVCQNDATWSVPDFRCIPCGNTPVIDNGVCGGGDYTLGASRVFKCNPGYFAVGNPNIVCQNDATWSVPDFKCIPCGNTPVIDNGVCGGGDYTLGASRVFQCNPGYFAVGNPNIVCQNDATWSVPDFKCIPCGSTPVIDNGVCGGGDYTLGASRVFTCNPGYFAVGNPNIVCQNDATWSVPDFKCIPCGNTPVIDNGVCGGGDYTLGASRRFKCNPGYFAVGNPNIVCQNDATWSVPDFKCIPCGNTPVIDNGVCGGGEYTLGASRVFTCNPGYFAVGNPNIVCQNDATWSLPDFKCIPCGNTPVIDNGVCGGGEYTLGASRVFKCNPGYFAVGNPNIVCQNDATWSVPDFKCIPCGNTPVIDNGVCGGGEYTLGASRVFKCNPGYFAVGNPNIVCQNDATWSVPDFKCIPCGNTPVIDNGVCGGGEYTLGASRVFTCNPGYFAVGNPNIVCQNDATWSVPDFKCIPCGNTPVIDNGVCGGGDYTLGASRVFTCNPGYFAVGNPNIVCQNDATWSVPDFKCIPCGNTPVIDNGVCGGGDYTLGASRVFTCNPGYFAVGNPNIVCQNDATWSLPDFKCIPCGNTPVIDNGVCGGGDYTLGASRVFTCNPGYFAVGNPNIVCQNDATWSVPDFKCIPCGNTPVIDNGVCGGGEYTLGASRVFKCNPGYFAVGNPNIVCQNDATWSVPDFKCIPCGNTPVIDNGVCGGGDYTLGASRVFKCNPGYFAVGNPNIVCQNDATWSVPDFKCIPCGNTPVIDNGVCGGGEYTLGASRVFTCNPGYFAVGNPNIVCQNDATWSVPDFKCIPCGNTPVIDNGVCGGGDYTLGARRTFKCNPGYAAIGNPEIMCRDDATWSIPDFKCIPCGETPVVPDATCGGGDHLVGTKRSFSCNQGYRPSGNPTIECLPTGQWSMPDFRCSDCGNPPMVPNAYTELGPSLLGSTRDYYCEVGYQMQGSGQIVCQNNGEWSRPQFSCNVRTTTTSTTPAPNTGDPSMCDGCRYINGVGYGSHPYDCNQYVQCFVGRRGFEPVFRKCPFGQFWDQNVLTCRPSHEVDCPTDKCRDPRVRGYRHADPDSCCSYWKCDGGRSYGECCGPLSSFDPRQGQCVRDDTCMAVCPYHDALQECDKRPTISETKFEQHIGNNYWVPMDCAAGTAFSAVDCECSLILMNIPGKRRQQVCRPEVYLPFTHGFEDRSGRNVYMRPENVSIHQGAAYFNGNSRILINRFSNTEFRGDLVVKFRYKEILQGPTAEQLQALVTNGDCGSDPSVIIGKMPGYVLLGAKTDKPRSFALPSLDKEWKEVIYIHNEQKLEGKVCGASMSKWSWGPIQATHCAMQIGYGNGLSNYMGYIDDFYVYQCRPRANILNLDY